MPHLILVRHSETDAVEGQPSHTWALSVVGRARNVLLAQELEPFAAEAIVSSADPAPVETARAVAAALDLNMHSAGGVEERRPNEPMTEALDRFSDGITALRKTYRDSNLVLVTGGRVIAGWLARHCGVDPEATEDALGYPSFVVVDDAVSAVVKVVPGV